jgi:hypothetical protein
MTNLFISEHSSFSCLNELIDASDYKVKSQEDFAAIPNDEWDEFINKNTDFANWQDMVNSASAIYARKRLGL